MNSYDLNRSNILKRGVLGLALALLALAAAPEAFARKACAGFDVTLSDGRTFGGEQNNAVIPVGSGLTAQVQGQFVSFTIDLNTFTVTNYTLRSDITANQPKVIFLRKQPLGKTLTGNLLLNLNGEQATFERNGPGVSLKIQAKDCSDGDIFDIEPEDTTVEFEHELGPDFTYCLDSLGRVLIVSATNPFVGREAPELAARTFPSGPAIVGAQLSRWLVQSEGEVEMVAGQEALAPLSSACGATAGGTPSPSPTATPSPSPTASPSPSASPTPVGMEDSIKAQLAGGAINGTLPEGEADFRRDLDGSTRLRVRLEEINLPQGTRLNVLVDGAKAGEIVIDEDGEGRFEIRTDNGQPVPPIVNGTTVVITNAAGATLLSGTFTGSLLRPGATPTPTPNPNPDTEPRVRIPLSGATINGMVPKGHAETRNRADGSRRFKVEVQDVNLPAGTLLDVFVDNKLVGRIFLSTLFRGELERNTNDGVTVPTVVAGTRVVVVNSSNGETVVAGSFGAVALARNPLDDKNFFVRQQYVDFLNRAPEQDGLSAWTGVMERCPNVAADASCDDVTVSSGFYRSPEFSDRGYYVFRLYDAVLGRLPRYNEFISGLSALGVDHNAMGLGAAKVRRAEALAQLAEFNSLYGGLTSPASAEAFVAKLEQTAGVTLAGRAQLIADMKSGAKTAAETVRQFAESPEVEGKFFYRGFVAMQYFGYLRRDPEVDGFNAWLNVLQNGAPGIQPGDYRTLIFGFVRSQEYRGRFGQP